MSQRLNAKAAIGAGPMPGGSERNDRRPLAIGALNEHLGYFLRRAQVWAFQDFMRKMAGTGLRPAQYSVLIVIAENPGLSQSDVADTLDIERARLVRLLDNLERRGSIVRRPSPIDRRSHALHLTREGEKMLKRAKARAAEHEAALIERIGADNHKLMLEVLRGFAR